MIVLGVAGMAYGCGGYSGNGGNASTSSTKADKKTTGIMKGYQKMYAHAAVEGSTANPKGEPSDAKGKDVQVGGSGSECKFFEDMPICVDGGKTAVVCIPNDEKEVEKIGEKLEKMFGEFEAVLDSMGMGDEDFDSGKLDEAKKEKYDKIVKELAELEEMKSSVKGTWMKYPCVDCKVSGELPSFDDDSMDDDDDLSLSCGGKDIFDDDDGDGTWKLPSFYEIGEGKVPASGAKKQSECRVAEEPVCDRLKDKMYICTSSAEDSLKIETIYNEFWNEISKLDPDDLSFFLIAKKFKDKIEKIKGQWLEYDCMGCLVEEAQKPGDGKQYMCGGKNIFKEGGNGGDNGGGNGNNVDGWKVPFLKLSQGKLAGNDAPYKGECAHNSTVICNAKKDTLYACGLSPASYSDLMKLLQEVEKKVKELEVEGKSKKEIEEEIDRFYRGKFLKIKGQWLEYGCSNCSVKINQDDFENDIIMCNGENIIDL